MKNPEKPVLTEQKNKNEKSKFIENLFGLEGKVAVITGGSGVLGREMAKGLALAGANVAIVSRNKERAEKVTKEILDNGGHAFAQTADVLNEQELLQARENIIARFKKIDILVNAAGGNKPDATIPENGSLFDLSADGVKDVFDLNLMGTFLPTKIFSKAMVQKDGEKGGIIVNISSMAAQKPLSRVIGYGAAKAGVDNLTRFIAVNFAQKHGDSFRVNAIAPGFFIGEQNKNLLQNENGSLTKRGQAIIDHTPAGRFGDSKELVGTLIWLCSPAAKFVNGAIIPVDGGFNANSGI